LLHWRLNLFGLFTFLFKTISQSVRVPDQILISSENLVESFEILEFLIQEGVENKRAKNKISNCRLLSNKVFEFFFIFIVKFKHPLIQSVKPFRDEFFSEDTHFFGVSLKLLLELAHFLLKFLAFLFNLFLFRLVKLLHLLVTSLTFLAFLLFYLFWLFFFNASLCYSIDSFNFSHKILNRIKSRVYSPCFKFILWVKSILSTKIS